MKIGLIEEDIINLIKYKKKQTTVCNQLSMVDDFMFHDFWWKMNGINEELYWELQYEWLDHEYFHTGVHKERMLRCLKKLNILGVISNYIKWVMWNTTVKINYQIHVKLPYQIRND